MMYAELEYGYLHYVGNPEWVEPASDCVESIDCSGGKNLKALTCNVRPGIPVFHDPEDAKRWEELLAQDLNPDQIIEQVVNEGCEGTAPLPKEWAEMNGFSGDADELVCDPTPPSGGSKSGKQTKTSKSHGMFYGKSVKT
jgi:hypothetical protein